MCALASPSGRGGRAQHLLVNRVSPCLTPWERRPSAAPFGEPRESLASPLGRGGRAQRLLVNRVRPCLSLWERWPSAAPFGEPRASLASPFGRGGRVQFWCVARAPCLSLWERWPSAVLVCRARPLPLPLGEVAERSEDGEGKRRWVNNAYTKRQFPIRKCPAASQGDDAPRTQALVSFSAQISGKDLQTADYRQIHRGLLLCFGQTGH